MHLWRPILIFYLKSNIQSQLWGKFTHRNWVLKYILIFQNLVLLRKVNKYELSSNIEDAFLCAFEGYVNWFLIKQVCYDETSA